MKKAIELAIEADSATGFPIACIEAQKIKPFLERFYTLARAGLEAELAAATNTNAKHVDLILRLEAENAKLRDALKKVQGDINWMLNTKQFLSGFVFDYIDEALGETK